MKFSALELFIAPNGYDNWANIKVVYFLLLKKTSGFATTKLWFGHIYSRQKVKFLGFEKKYIISLMLEFTNYGPKLTSYECFRYIFKKIH